MKQINLIIGTVAITLLLFVRLVLLCAIKLLWLLVWLPSAATGLLLKSDLFLGDVMQNVINIVKSEDHD